MSEEEQEVQLLGQENQLSALLLASEQAMKDAAWKEEYARRLMHAALSSKQYEVRRRMYQTALKHAAQARELRKGEAISAPKQDENYQIPFADLLEDESVASMFEEEQDFYSKCKMELPVLAAIKDFIQRGDSSPKGFQFPPLIVSCGDNSDDISKATSFDLEDESVAVAELAKLETTTKEASKEKQEAKEKQQDSSEKQPTLQSIVASMSYPKKKFSSSKELEEADPPSETKEHPIHAGMLSRGTKSQQQQEEEQACQEVSLTGPILDEKEEEEFGTFEGNEVFMEIEPEPRNCASTSFKNPFTRKTKSPQVAIADLPQRERTPPSRVSTPPKKQSKVSLSNGTKSPTAVADLFVEEKKVTRSAPEAAAVAETAVHIGKDEKTTLDAAVSDEETPQNKDDESEPTGKKSSVVKNEKEKDKPTAIWKSAVDNTTGKTYYYNRATRETTWIKPVGGNNVIVKPLKKKEEEAEYAVGEERIKRPSKPSWLCAVDPDTSKTYYYHRKTSQTCWIKPKEYDEQHAEYKRALQEYKDSLFPTTAQKKETPFANWYKKNSINKPRPVRILSRQGMIEVSSDNLLATLEEEDGEKSATEQDCSQECNSDETKQENVEEECCSKEEDSQVGESEDKKQEHNEEDKNVKVKEDCQMGGESEDKKQQDDEEDNSVEVEEGATVGDRVEKEDEATKNSNEEEVSKARESNEKKKEQLDVKQDDDDYKAECSDGESDSPDLNVPELNIVESFASEAESPEDSDVPQGLEAVLAEENQVVDGALDENESSNDKLSQSLHHQEILTTSSDLTMKAENLSGLDSNGDVAEEKALYSFQKEIIDTEVSVKSVKEKEPMFDKAGPTERVYEDSRDPEDVIDNGEEVLLVEKVNKTKSKKRSLLPVLKSRRKATKGEQQQGTSRSSVVLSDMHQDKTHDTRRARKGKATKKPSNASDTEVIDIWKESVNENEFEKPVKTSSMGLQDVSEPIQAVVTMLKSGAITNEQSSQDVPEQIQAVITMLKSGAITNEQSRRLRPYSAPLEPNNKTPPIVRSQSASQAGGQEMLLVQKKSRRLPLRPFLSNKSKGTKVKANKKESVLILSNDVTCI